MVESQSVQDDEIIILRAHPTTFYDNIAAVEDTFTCLGETPQVKEVVLDLSHTFRLDSRGLRILVDLHRRLQEREGSLVLTGVSPALRRLLEYARLDRFFVIRSHDAAVPSPFSTNVAN